MERNFKNFFGLIGEKAKGSGVVSAFEQSREGQPKAYIPNFFYKPPFGYPRYKNLVYQRQLASSVYVDMCTTAIMDEVVSIPWGIVAEDKDGNKIIGKEKEMQIVEDFFMNPNTNPESWETIVKMMLSDLLEINSGIMVKVFNSFGKMVEIVARDGISFTKNPDVYGMFTNRADIILMKNIYDEKDYDSNNGYPLLQGFLTPDQAQEKGAYFQYGFSTGAKPIPYGKREIVWFEKKVRTDDIYGRSPMDVLQKTVQTLIYAVEHNLEYFSDNSIPPGVLGLDGLSTEDMKAFGQQWTESQKKTDDLGNWKKVFHKLAMVNRTPKFERLGFTNQELELIESQKWWAKMVWSIYGLTATELGFTEDAKGSANQIVQTSAAKRRIIYPLLRLIEYYVNTEIVSEFGFEGIKYKYKIFDVDEETKKWSLYKLQTDSNLKTVNEIRALEGLDSLEGGDETSTMRTERNQQADRQLIDPNQQEVNQINQDSQDDRDQMNGKTLSLKYKYVKRTGSPGNYIYWYKNPKTGKVERGDEPKKFKKIFEETSEKLKDYAEEYKKEGNHKMQKDCKKISRLLDEGNTKEAVETFTNSELKYDISNTYSELRTAHEKNEFNKEFGEDWGTKSGTFDVYRAGEVGNQKNGIFFGASKEEVLSYEDENRKVKKYSVTIKNPLVAGRVTDAYHQLTGKKKEMIDMREGDWLKLDETVARLAKKAGYDSITYVDPAPPATRELAILDKESVEIKASTTDSQPNEEMGERKLKNSIVELLKENKKNIIDVLESQTKKEPLMIIKGIDDIPKMIKKIFSFFTFKKISDEIINSKFSEGWDYSEKKIDRNVQYNEKALEFLQEYTFGNIKGMTEEIANDLKAELERGIINGEGINKLKGRVERVFNVGENRAEMIARTETNRAENNGKLLAMKGSGLEMMKKWITHKDDRTSPICRRLDGQIVKIDEDFEDSSGWEGQSPPSHVNCRSTLVFISKEEYEQSQEEKKEVKKDLKEQIGISFNTSPSVQHKVTKALLDAINEKKEEEQIDQDIDLKLKEEDMKIKKRKQELLKKLEGEIGRD